MWRYPALYLFQFNLPLIVGESICGNGIKESPEEECDDGNTVSGDGCSATCKLEAPSCGNGILEIGEECDDGNIIGGDGCSSACKIESNPGDLCGNGVLDPLEQCDDGNVVGGDGCSSTCTLEHCYGIYCPCLILDEGDTGPLTCPPNMVITGVLFAGYGLPEGMIRDICQNGRTYIVM
jgi:cysteine-rich repeat protein